VFNKVLFSDKLSKENKDYSFFIKKSKNGKLYLQLVENVTKEEKNLTNNIYVFEEDLFLFSEKLFNVMNNMIRLKEQKEKTISQNSNKEIEFSSYKWESEEIDQLIYLYNKGKNIQEISNYLLIPDFEIEEKLRKLHLDY
jgi:hypothetical protein